MSTVDEDPFARRAFIGKVAAGTLALASAPILAASAELSGAADNDPWLKALKGKHKAVFDAPIVNDGMYPSVVHRMAGDYSAPLQLLAKRLSFIDPLSGVERGYASNFLL